MASDSPARAGGSIREKLSALLVEELRDLASAAGERAAHTISDRISSVTQALTEYATDGGDPGQAAVAAGARKLAGGGSPVSAAVTAATSGAKQQLKHAFGRERRKGGQGKLKVTNIVEYVDVGVPVRVAYNQWTQFEDFPGFMKKVENVERESDQELTWKAQVFWSHRSWTSTVVEQVPDERIVWRSRGEKGSVDGAVSFHAVTATLTRIVLVLEYRPQGFLEHVGNIWRAQGRRARLELKHFVRHVMTQTALHLDEVEGWRGEIRGGEVVRDHEPGPAPEQEGESAAVEEQERKHDVEPAEKQQNQDEPAEPEALPDEPRPTRPPRQRAGRRTAPARRAPAGDEGQPVRRRRGTRTTEE